MFPEPTVTMTKILNLIYSIRFLLLFLSTLFFTLMAFLFFWTRHTFLNKLNIDYYLMRLWGRSLTFIYGIKRVRNYDSAKDGQPGVYVAPHSSFWDIIVLGSELNGFFVSKAEVLKWPVIGLGAKFVRTVFIDREKGVSALKSMERSAEKIFKNGNSLIVFPEGTRSYDHMQHLKAGPFHVAMQTGCPVKPVIIKYEPRASIVPRIKGNFMKELFTQAQKVRNTKVIIERLPDVSPKDFKSVDELKKYVHEVMNVHYNQA
jgi:1-acyl-sn-glycerol-3-phosphate acyltransferase